MIGFVVMICIFAACIVTGIFLRMMKFQRDCENKMISGVCAGLAKGCHIQPLWMRLGFVLSIILVGYGLGLYIILWILLPEE